MVSEKWWAKDRTNKNLLNSILVKKKKKKLLRVVEHETLPSIANSYGNLKLK